MSPNAGFRIYTALQLTCEGEGHESEDWVDEEQDEYGKHQVPGERLRCAAAAAAVRRLVDILDLVGLDFPSRPAHRQTGNDQ